MPYGLYLSAAGASVQNHRLEVLSNNLANVETPGFKPQQSIAQARFAELIERGEESPGTGGPNDIGGGVTIRPTATRFTAGTMRQTGNPTDFALNDPQAFFMIERDGQPLLTRAGDFHFDNAGRLVTPSGDAVLGMGNRPIQIDPTLPYDVVDGGNIQQEDDLFSLLLARSPGPGQLEHVGGNLFRSAAPIGLVPPEQRAVVSGFVEQSAVRPTTAMMELIEASRAYEANVRMIQNQDHVIGSLISRVLQS